MRRSELRMQNTVAFAALLMLSVKVAAGTGPSNIQIIGPTDVIPRSQPLYSVSWEGGTPPWTIQFDATDPGFNFAEEQMINELSCSGSVCESFPVLVNYSTPQISEVTATVVDALGQSASAPPLRVRVGSEGSLHIVNRPTVNVRPDPADPGRFLCLGDEFDPPYMDAFEQDGTTFLDVYGDDQIPPPTNLVIASQSLMDFSFATVFGVADTDWVQTRPFPPPETEIALNFPLVYGDYSDPDTTPWEDPLVPSPPLAELTRYTMRVPTPPNCNDGNLTRFMEFFLNPADAGDLVVSDDSCPSRFERQKGETSCTLLNDAPLVTPFTKLRRNDRLAVGRSAFTSCVDENLEGQVWLLVLAAVEEFEITHEPIPANLGEIILFRVLEESCHALLDKSNNPGRGLEEPKVEFSVESGALHVETAIPDVTFVATTEFASVTTSAPVIYSVLQLPGDRTILNGGNETITVVPANKSLPSRELPPRFQVVVDGSSISIPELANFIFAATFD